ncbi:transposase [Granulicella arctica]|uniref:Transposase n=1 Tax=Granulicella arctica TaxID=940613 RepID=A0A7Y9PFK8_9BACT|nr:transposase [Granulicella arctica]
MNPKSDQTSCQHTEALPLYAQLAYVDRGYTGPNAAEPAQQHGLRLEVVKHPMAKQGFVLRPRRWAVERSFAWAARFRRLARDYERPDTTLKGLHLLAFVVLTLRNLAKTIA